MSTSTLGIWSRCMCCTAATGPPRDLKIQQDPTGRRGTSAPTPAPTNGDAATIRPHDCLFSSLIRPHDCLFSSLQKVLPLLRAHSQPQVEHYLELKGGGLDLRQSLLRSEEIRQEVLSFYSTRKRALADSFSELWNLCSTSSEWQQSRIWYELVDVLEAGTEHEVSLDISSIRSRWFLYSMSQPR
ncbi:hypothetical protein EJB05_22613, partial [Eragrostis curvula]